MYQTNAQFIFSTLYIKLHSCWSIRHEYNACHLQQARSTAWHNNTCTSNPHTRLNLTMLQINTLYTCVNSKVYRAIQTTSHTTFYRTEQQHQAAANHYIAPHYLFLLCPAETLQVCPVNRATWAKGRGAKGLHWLRFRIQIRTLHILNSSFTASRKSTRWLDR